MKLWVGTSWKMNKTLAEALEFVAGLRAFIDGLDDGVDARVQPFVMPSFTVIREVARALADTPVLVGAQNMHWAERGPWTGEVSPPQVQDCGAEMVELGHSERRTHFGETDDTVARKVEAAVRFGLTPLICVGETFEQRQRGRTDDVLRAQTEGALRLLTGGQRAAPILFAYEPVWAIGAGGTPASPDDADARQRHIKEVAGSVLAAQPPVLYGGSVNPGNAADLVACAHIDGVFVGRAAWSAQGYVELLTIAAEAAPC